MKPASYMGLCFVLVFLQACHKNDQYRRQAKTLDSLSGTVNAMARGLEKTDTVVLQKSIARFNYYKQFILQNIHDTITKNEADNLKHFYAGGNSLEVFLANRKLILARAGLVNSQLTKLSEDVKNKIEDAEQLEKFITLEKSEAASLTDLGYGQQQMFHTGFEEFKNSLHTIEELIKSRNNGDLPTIIKDTIVL